MSLLEGLSRPWRDDETATERSSRPGLRVVPDRPSRRPRAPFVVLMLIVLGVGLVGLLLLNTSLQQGSFVVHDLQTKAEDLRERQAGFAHRLAEFRAPENLARRAREQGMVENPDPAFLRLSDGAVLGKAEPAEPSDRQQHGQEPTAHGGGE